MKGETELKLCFLPHANKGIVTREIGQLFPNAIYDPACNSGKGGYTVEVDSVEQLYEVFSKTWDEELGQMPSVRLDFRRRPDGDGVLGCFYFIR